MKLGEGWGPKTIADMISTKKKTLSFTAIVSSIKVNVGWGGIDTALKCGQEEGEWGDTSKLLNPIETSEKLWLIIKVFLNFVITQK